MKTNFFLQKAAMLKSCFAAFLLLGLSGAAHVNAQCIIPPVFADNIVGPVGSPNSSTISYVPFCTVGCATTNSQLTAVVTGGPAGPPPLLFVNDQVVPFWLPNPVPAPPTSVPDVVVGNDLSSPGDYIVAVVFTMPTFPANDVFITTYSVTNVGTGGLLVTPLVPPTNISGTGNVIGSANMDIIAQYSTPYFGLPQANIFVVTWQDQTLGIMGYAASLGAPATGVTQQIDANLNCSSPDVAGIEITGPQFYAVFSYVDQTGSPNILYENEWNISAATVVGPVLYDNTHTYINVMPNATVAKIAAIDDLNQNIGSGNAYFDIVAAAPNPPNPGISILEYNNFTGAGVATDITSPLTCIPFGQNIVPAVTCGPGPIYTVGYFSNGADNQYNTRAVGWTTGVPPGPPAIEYQIPMNPFGPSPGVPWGIALSATSNTEALGTQNLFAAWENTGAIWEKYTILPYAFKEPAAVTAVTATADWQLYPNPANDQITLTAPTGFNLINGAKYSITDMAGRALMQNSISDATEQINISNLSNGMYLLNIHADETNTKTIKFVKE